MLNHNVPVHVNCFFFIKLADSGSEDCETRPKEGNAKISADEMKGLASLCNFTSFYMKRILVLLT